MAEDQDQDKDDQSLSNSRRRICTNKTRGGKQGSRVASFHRNNLSEQVYYSLQAGPDDEVGPAALHVQKDEGDPIISQK
jgi:hypothetical protein